MKAQSKNRKSPTCSRCRFHGDKDVRVLQHKCPYKDCTCSECLLTKKRSVIYRAQKNLDKQDENSNEVSSPGSGSTGSSRCLGSPQIPMHPGNMGDSNEPSLQNPWSINHQPPPIQPSHHQQQPPPPAQNLPPSLVGPPLQPQLPSQHHHHHPHPHQLPQHHPQHHHHHHQMPTSSINNSIPPNKMSGYSNIKNFQTLCLTFPDYSPSHLQTLFEQCGNDFDKTIDKIILTQYIEPPAPSNDYPPLTNDLSYYNNNINHVNNNTNSNSSSHNNNNNNPNNNSNSNNSSTATNNNNNNIIIPNNHNNNNNSNSNNTNNNNSNSNSSNNNIATNNNTSSNSGSTAANNNIINNTNSNHNHNHNHNSATANNNSNNHNSNNNNLDYATNDEDTQRPPFTNCHYNPQQQQQPSQRIMPAPNFNGHEYTGDETANRSTQQQQPQPVHNNNESIVSNNWPPYGDSSRYTTATSNYPNNNWSQSDYPTPPTTWPNPSTNFWHTNGHTANNYPYIDQNDANAMGYYYGRREMDYSDSSTSSTGHLDRNVARPEIGSNISANNYEFNSY